jgi:tetratricopeptide (TPR) repeat protein
VVYILAPLTEVTQLLGNPAAANTLYKRAISLIEAGPLPKNKLADELWRQGDGQTEQGHFKAAKRFYDRALEIDQALADRLYNSAILLTKDKLVDGDDDKLFGRNDPTYELSFRANVLEQHQCFTVARLFCERALDIRERVFGGNSLRVMKNLKDLARIQKAEGNISAARPCLSAP